MINLFCKLNLQKTKFVYNPAWARICMIKLLPYKTVTEHKQIKNAIKITVKLCLNSLKVIMQIATFNLIPISVVQVCKQFAWWTAACGLNPWQWCGQQLEIASSWIFWFTSQWEVLWNRLSSKKPQLVTMQILSSATKPVKR